MIEMREVIIGDVEYDSWVDKTARAEIADLNAAVFDMEEVPPSINLFNPDTAVQELAHNTTDLWLWVSDTIPCAAGDLVRVRVRGENNTIAAANSSGGLAFRRVCDSGRRLVSNATFVQDYTVQSYEGETIVGVEVGVRVGNVPDNDPNNIMVTLNQLPEVFEDYYEGGVEKHDKVEKNRADLQGQIDALTEQTEGIAADVEALKESLIEDDTDIAEDVEALNAAVFGDSKPYVFDSDTDEFGTGEFGMQGQLIVGANHYIPMFDISGDPVTVRIYSYNSNGVEADRDSHSLYTCQYDADGNFISGTRQKLKFYAVDKDGNIATDSAHYISDIKYIERAPTVSDTSGFAAWKGGGIVTITPAEGAKYAIIFAIFDGVDIDIKLWAGDEPVPSGLIYEVSELDKRVNELDEAIHNFEPEETYDIVDGNEALIHTVFGNSGGGIYKTDFAAVVITDLHGKFVSLDDAVYLRDKMAKDAVILNAGDMIDRRGKQDGAMSEDAIAYMEKAVECGVYHTMGQHELGINIESIDGRDGQLKENCMSHEEAFDFYIKPMREKWGLPNLDTIYYYKDFNKTRLISLYQYNMPLVDDETNPNRYKFNRSLVWYGQEQLDWLVETLNSTPDGYRVIILQHSNEMDVVAEEGTNFSGWTSSTLATTPIAGTPVKDIVQAYINKTTLTKTYASTSDDYPADLFTVTVNADFTNAQGEFGHYIAGDCHVDCVGHLRNTNQRHIFVTSSGASYDCRVIPTANDASRSIVTLMGYDYTRKFLRLGRVGQQYALNGQTRVLEKVTLTTKE